MPRPGFIDQMLFVLERGGQLPRLQLRMESQTIPGQRLALIGDVRNVSEQPANKVRIFMTGVELVLGVGTLTGGDPPLPVRIVYDDQPARTQEQQFPAVFAQFLSDDGRKVQQEGLLLDHTDASRRHTYTLRGLEGPHPIEVFSHRHDPLENL
jgi:hypothetical protein